MIIGVYVAAAKKVDYDAKSASNPPYKSIGFRFTQQRCGFNSLIFISYKKIIPALLRVS